MTVLEEARKTIHSTNGINDLLKFIDLADKFHDRFTTQTQKIDFELFILSKLDDKAYEIGKNCDPPNWANI
jgi:hypothetical protein